MKGTKIAIRYSKALFTLAIEQNKIDKVKTDIDQVLETCKTSREFRALLSSPLVNETKKQQVIKAIFENNVEKITLDFLLLATINGREAHLASISKHFVDLYKDYKAIESVTLTTAYKLDDTIKEEILGFTRKIIDKEKKQIDLTENVNTNLIGGFTLSIKDKRLDASIQRKIKELKREFSQNLFVKTK